MLRYIIKRIIASIPVILIVAIFAFFIIHMVPGNPAEVMLGAEATTEDVAALTEKLGLDQPLPVQFVKWAENALHGDLGDSIFYGMPVLQVLGMKMEPTIVIVIYAITIGILTGVPLGIVSAIFRDKWPDRVCTAFAMIGISLPGFLLGLFIILFFAIDLNLFPSVGYYTIKEVGFVKSVFYYLTLPAFTLGIQRSASFARITRSSMLEVLDNDYIRTARAKGLKETTVILKHALKNAMGQILTQLGFSLAALAAGTVVIETLFNISGMGQIAYYALVRRDYPLVQGYILIIAMVYILINLAVDIAYKFFDPRINLA